MATILLAPFDQGDGVGTDLNWDIVDTPTPLPGGTSLSDDSDVTGYTIGAEFDLGGFYHGEPVHALFKTPGGFNPTALLLVTRMRNADDVLSTSMVGGRQMELRLSSADGVTTFDTEHPSAGGGDPVPISPILDAIVDTPTDYTWYGTHGAGTIDLGNPSEAGGWYQLDWSFTGAAGDRDALMGDGLRVDLGIFWGNTADGVHRDWIELYEVRLLVAGTYRSAAPRRRYPRADGYGIGPTRHYPRPHRGVGGIV